MERNVPSLLLIHLVFILSAPPCAESAGNISMVVIHGAKTWLSAQEHCRKFYNDLVTIRNQQEDNELAQYEGWIGLHEVPVEGWIWSRGDEKPNFINWASGEPDSHEYCAFKRRSPQKWINTDCERSHRYMCEEILTLAQEKMTWQEALEHCRATNYDLVNLPKANYFLLNGEMIKQQATTNEVWIGLRFLAGEWWWMNGQRATSSDLLHCPAQHQHCGALLRNEKRLTTMNCSEKRNFFCGKKR